MLHHFQQNVLDYLNTVTYPASNEKHLQAKATAEEIKRFAKDKPLIILPSKLVAGQLDKD